MDKSISSDFFSETDISYSNSVIMDSVPYETLISNTKLALSSRGHNEIKKSTFSTYFTSLLEDCQSCISQGLDLIINILSDSDIQIIKVIEYVNDAVSILQKLSDFIKTVIESLSMVCRSMKIFPITTSDIILKIFMHCKDSECLYGSYLSNVEKELKDLFRSCHELQLTYLMIMEKHFVFDVTEQEDVETLMDALNINLKIGDIVQTLDVKTMAEQWKAFTAICEKYSNTLMDKNIYNNSLRILSEMIENNIKTALQKDQDDKVVLRSLKVTSFVIKILIKICNIFKHASLKNHQGMCDLLILIYSNNSAILEMDSERSSQILNLINVNVSLPSEQLLRELLSDINFSNLILDYDISTLQNGEKHVGYILILIFVIKSTLHGASPGTKNKIIKAIFDLLRSSHTHMIISIKLPTEIKSVYETQGLYENVLTHFVAFSTTLNSEEFRVLEGYLIESILGCDCGPALFVITTWSILARVMPLHLLFNQLTSLCKIYQKLEKDKLFSHSPQKVYLSYTIRCLYEVMENEDKLKIFQLFNILDEKNYNLWCSLQINNLPEDLQLQVEDMVVDRLKILLKKTCLDGSEFEKMITLLNLSPTRCFRNNNIVDCLIKSWEKTCPKNNSEIISDLSKDTLWHCNYVSSLVSVTKQNVHFLQSSHIIKVLHVIAEIVKTGNTELKLLVMDVIWKFISHDVNDSNRYTIESYIIHVLKYLSQDTENVVKYKLHCSLKELQDSPYLQRIMTVLTKDDLFKNVWKSLNSGVSYKNKWREEILLKYCKYHHKCIENNMADRLGSIEKTCSGNFELVDIDLLFENESDSEPVHKKVKLSHDEADAIISRLEADVSSLCQIKEFSYEQKTKLKILCDQLRYISD